MYRVLLADDEGIVLNSLQFIIEKNFGESCEIRTAKTGRTVVEVAQEFSPDIAFLDIQMPGLTGIDAMKEIRTFNQRMVFIVVSAYDKFGFAQKALDYGALEYILKPFDKEKIVKALEHAMGVIDESRKKRSKDLEVKEKLQSVVPVIESGFMNLILLQEDFTEEMGNYRQLLDIQEEYGMVMVMQFGEQGGSGGLENPVGSSVRMQGSSVRVREVIKEFFSKAIVSSIIANKMIVFLPWAKKTMEFEERSQVIEYARNLSHKLQKQMGMVFRIGIGGVYTGGTLHESFEEAQKALRMGRGRVIHSQDIQVGRRYEEDYPAELEDQLFHAIRVGNIEKSKASAGLFFDWMVRNYGEHPKDIQTKVLEFVMTAEREVFLQGGMRYGLLYRKDYLDTVIACKSYEELRWWFLRKISEACRNVTEKKQVQKDGVIEKAKEFISTCYDKEVSLEEVSKHVDISSYYFSKLFKEKEGKNFVEYVTELRMEKAKQMLQNQDATIKEVCLSVGYSDPNYFSRIFKKATGCTPTDYKERREN